MICLSKFEESIAFKLCGTTRRGLPIYFDKLSEAFKGGLPNAIAHKSSVYEVGYVRQEGLDYVQMRIV